MALTIAATSAKDIVVSNKKRKVRRITFDSSYLASGETITPANFGLRVIDEFIVHGPFRKSDNSDAILVSYDGTNGVLHAYLGKNPADAGGADVAFPEVASTTNLAAYSGVVTVIGV